MTDFYFVVDVETCPIDLETYESLDEEQKLKLLNPIDSKIIALGIRFNGENKIFISEDERKILEEFWNEWRSMMQSHQLEIVGFNITNFDLPFITTRSLINNVVISPFTIKSVIDLREKINAYRFGKSRGKLKDFSKLLGIKTTGIDGSEIAKLCKEKNHEKIKEYLISDLEVTDALYKRAKETKILYINKW